MDATPPPAAEPEPLPLPLPPSAAPLPNAPAPLPHDDQHPPIGFTLRRLAHILILLFSLFLVVRTTFVEPFGVTTGSMAETIHGNRREKPCPRCGCPVCVGSPDEPTSAKNPQAGVVCPNCGLEQVDVSGEPETFGDRLLVDKLVYRLRSPRRWEVAVFRCPQREQRPAKGRTAEFTAFDAHLPLLEDHKPYVKRVVGLPGERIRVFDGDVYANGQLLRKSLDQVRETRIPAFRMDFAPAPNGWGSRWEVGPVVGSPPLPKDASPTVTVGTVAQGDSLVFDATAAPLGLTYRHRDLDNGKDDVVRDRIGYNGSKPVGQSVPVHDFLVECELEVVGGEGGAFALRLGDGADTVKVHLPIHADGTSGSALIAHEGGTEQPFAKPFALVPGKQYRLEFGFIDRRVFVAIDGKEATTPLDLPQVPAAKGTTDPAGKRAGQSRPVQLGCRGGHVVVRHFSLWRDIHYRNDLSGGKHAVTAECPLGPNEYFMLGDNTASSSDSREWDTPGVPEHDFLGKPFLVHQPLKASTVPVLGRVQAVDWERFRLLE